MPMEIAEEFQQTHSMPPLPILSTPYLSADSHRATSGGRTCGSADDREESGQESLL